MKLNIAIWLDKTIVRFLSICLNLLVRLVGKILWLNHDLSKPFKTIAICKFKGMGSVVQASAMMATLRKNYPDAKIIFITARSNKALVQRLPYVDEVVTLNDSSFFALLLSFWPFIFRLWRKRIQLYFDLEIYSNFSSMVAAMSCARNRIGFYIRSGHYRMGIYSHMMFYNVNAPVSQAYMQMIRLLPLKEEVHGLQPVPYNKTNVRPEIKEITTAADYMVVNPNASDLRLERRWPIEYFVKAIEHILHTTTLRVILIGAGSEKEYTGQLFTKVNNARVLNYSGKTNLDELLCMIENAKLVLTNDTGPMHLAFAYQKPTVALFGPCSPKQYAVGGKVKIIYKAVYCSPCVHEFIIPPCRGNNVCMKNITLTEVNAAMDDLLKGGKGDDAGENIWYAATDNYLPGLVKRQKS